MQVNDTPVNAEDERKGSSSHLVLTLQRSRLRLASAGIVACSGPK